MSVLDECRALLEQARDALVEGRQDEALATYRHVGEHVGGDPAALQEQPELEELFDEATRELVEVLRWERRYDEVIALEKEWIARFPEQEFVRRTQMAATMIERGEVDEGIAELEAVAAADADNIWVWITLGVQCLWIGRDADAVRHLQRALDTPGAEPADEATAHYYLFRSYAVQGRREDAVAAWREARRLDPAMQSSLPEVYRMLIEAGDEQRARSCLRQERNRLRYIFYSGLLDWRRGDEWAAQRQWQRLARMDSADYTQGHEAWVEACLRAGRVEVGLAEATRLVQGQPTVERLVLLALTRAMAGDLHGAQQALDGGVLLLDHGQPRRDRLSAAEWQRFGELLTDRDALAELEGYFQR